ncbi:MAG: hypothetical protein WEA80_06530 [Gemmatimonadaceae bacterium]
MKYVWVPVLLVSVVGCASSPTSAAPAGVRSSVSPAPIANVHARVPAQVGEFKLTERAAVGGAPADSLYRFRDSSRTNLTVFIYEIAADVRVEADSQQWTAREGGKFKEIQDIRVARGQIAEYVLAFSDTTRIAVGEHNILEHRMATPVRFPSGAVAVDMQFLYLVGGKFIKVRATIPEQGWEQTRVPSFARELALRLARGT